MEGMSLARPVFPDPCPIFVYIGSRHTGFAARQGLHKISHRNRQVHFLLCDLLNLFRTAARNFPTHRHHRSIPIKPLIILEWTLSNTYLQTFVISDPVYPLIFSATALGSTFSSSATPFKHNLTNSQRVTSEKEVSKNSQYFFVPYHQEVV